jgi:hypothetical protein
MNDTRIGLFINLPKYTGVPNLLNLTKRLISPYTHLLMSVMLALSIMITVYLVNSVYYGEYESIFAAITSNFLVDNQEDFWFSDLQFLILPILGKLSRVYKDIPVYAIWLLFLNFCWLTILVYYALKVASSHKNKWRSFAMFFPVILISCVESVTLLHSNRISILMSGFSLLLFFDENSSKREKNLCLPLFLLSTISRSQTALLTFFMIFMLQLIKGGKFFKLLKTTMPFLLIGIVFNTAFYVNGFITKNHGEHILAKYELAIASSNGLYHISEMKNSVDSTKYIAIKNFLISDSASMTADFFEKVVNAKFHFYNFVYYEEVKISLDKIIELCGSNKVIIISIFLIALLDIGSSPSRVAAAKKYFYYFVSFSVFTFLITVSVDIYQRIFNPFLIVVFVFISVGYIRKTFDYKVVSTIGLLIVLWFITYASFKEVHERTLQFKTANEMYVRWLGYINGITKQRTVMVLMNTDIPENTNPFYINYPDYKRYIMIDVGLVAYYPFFKEKFSKVHGFSPVNFISLFDYWRSNQDSLLILSNESRIELFQRYFREVYGKEFLYQKAESLPEELLDNNDHLYRIIIDK